MLAEDASYLQEADFGESEFGESAYDGYDESDAIGEYYPYNQQQAYPQQPYGYQQPSYGIQMPQFRITPPGFIRRIWSAQENRFVVYRWNILLRRWIRVTPRVPPYGASPYQPGYPGMQQPYPGAPGYPGYPGQPAYPGQPGYPGMPPFPGQPGMPGMPGAQAGGGRRRRRRRRRR
jgi:hypothetical protein